MSLARVLVSMVAAALSLPPSLALAHPCAPVLGVHPVAGSPGTFRIETPTRAIIAHAPPAPRGGTAINFTVHALAETYDFDGNPATVVDTLVVPLGSTVRFQWVTGFHTLTEGLNSGDLATARFDYVLDPTHTTFDTTFSVAGKMNFFCQIHELADRNQSMAGTIWSGPPLDVRPGEPVARATFSQPPSPNPSRGSVSFAIALPAERTVVLTVHDVTGRAVAAIARGVYGAGEHAFTWSGRSDVGARLAPGHYIVSLHAGSVTEVRGFTLLR